MWKKVDIESKEIIWGVRKIMYQDWMEYIPIIGPIMQKCPHCGMKIEAKEIFCTYCAEKVR